MAKMDKDISLQQAQINCSFLNFIKVDDFIMTRN